MAKSILDATFDEMLDVIADSDELVVCSQQPTTYTEATSTYALGDYALTGGDFSKADAAGVGGGRTLTVASQSGNNGDATGTGNHIALVKTTGTILRYVTTCNDVDVVTGVAFNTAPVTVILRDPT